MKKILVLTVLLLALGTENVSALSLSYLNKKCENIAKKNFPKIDIVYQYGKVAADNSKSSDEILQIAKSKGIKQVIPSAEMKGLTTFSFYINSIELQAEAIALEDNLFCYYPTHLTVGFGNKESTVYLSNQLKKGTCEYNRVLRHEYAHLEVSHKAIDLYAKFLQEKLPEVVKKVGGKLMKYRYGDDKFLEEFEKETAEFELVLPNMRDKYNQKLDSVENYVKEQMLCK